MKKYLFLITFIFSGSLIAQEYIYNVNRGQTIKVNSSNSPSPVGEWIGNIHSITGTIYDPDGFDIDGYGPPDCNLDISLFYYRVMLESTCPTYYWPAEYQLVLDGVLLPTLSLISHNGYYYELNRFYDFEITEMYQCGGSVYNARGFNKFSLCRKQIKSGI